MTATKSERPAWLDLFLISVGSLYLELAFLRLLASEIRVFAHVKNRPLLAAFIGLGLGFSSQRSAPFALWMFALFCLLLTGASAFGLAAPHRPDVVRDHHRPLRRHVAGLLPTGGGTGAWFERVPPLQADAVDVSGALLGSL
jgi:hypothetical protein